MSGSGRRGGAVAFAARAGAQIPQCQGRTGLQYLFPAVHRSVDPRIGRIGRHRLSEEVLQRAVRAAQHRAGTIKVATCHTLRHSFATYLPEAGRPIFTVEEQLGLKVWLSRGAIPMCWRVVRLRAQSAGCTGHRRRVTPH
nr:tyrosine-type recombinase/integrase [uncultured Xanthomonas sp.]